MIKVTINYKTADDGCGTDATYLINTSDHVLAIIMATEAYDRDHADATTTYLSSKTETEVLEHTRLRVC